jgi:hypothetical protein
MGARVFVLNHDILGKDAARINLFVALHIGLAGFCAWSTLFAVVSHVLYFTLRCLGSAGTGLAYQNNVK